MTDPLVRVRDASSVLDASRVEALVGRLSDEERAHVRHPEEEPAYFKEREPDRLRLHESPPGRRIIRNVGLILIGIAVVAGIVGLVLMFTA